MIFALAAADLKERVRYPSFSMLAGAALLASFYFVPSQGMGFRTLIISSEKFIQAGNPTWIPLATSIIAGVFLPLAGFAMCTGGITRERKSGMYFTLSAQGMSKTAYVTGKFISNFCVLLLLLLVMLLGAFCMISIRFFLQPISLWALFSPFLAVIPGLAFAAAAAVFMECLPIFKNAAPLCITVFLVFHFTMLVNAVSSESFGAHCFDISGYAWLHDSILSSAGEGAAVTILGGGSWIKSTGTEQLFFEGLPLYLNRLLQKTALIMSSLFLLIPSAMLLEKYQSSAKASRKVRLTDKLNQLNALPKYIPLPFVFKIFGKSAFASLYFCELKRILKEMPRIWFLLEAGLFVFSVFVPVSTVYSMLVPIMFGIAVLMFSKLGCNGALNGMDKLLSTMQNGLMRKTIAEGLAALSVSVILSSAALIRGFALLSVRSGLSLLAFAVLSPLLALLIGRLCKTPRVFELGYTALIFVMLNAPGLIIKL